MSKAKSFTIDYESFIIFLVQKNCMRMKYSSNRKTKTENKTKNIILSDIINLNHYSKYRRKGQEKAERN